jgi:O-acetyl-ADP-ribose deacetylase (regulator of RNase III)/uncharacterized protein YwgA
MVKVMIGDIFNSEAQTLVNTVNCVGVMGKGIAFEFKKRFPDMFRDYAARCQRGEVKLGEPYLYKSIVPPWILNFPTKDHWRSLTKVKDIEAGLEYLLAHYQEWDITSIAVPPLGSGLGQLEWRIVGPVLFQYLNKMDIDVELFAPYGTPTDQLELTFLLAERHPGQLTLADPESTWIDASWVALVEILRRVEMQPYHWPVGRITFQKMAYVAQALGLPLGIEFRRGSYGPYSQELKPMVSRLMNNGLIAEEQQGRMFRVMSGPTFETASTVYYDEIQQWEPILDRVSKLFMRANTKRAELIASVVYATAELESETGRPPSEREVVEAILDWKIRRKPPIVEEELAATVRNLAVFGWPEIAPSEGLKLPDSALHDA